MTCCLTLAPNCDSSHRRWQIQISDPTVFGDEQLHRMFIAFGGKDPKRRVKGCLFFMKVKSCGLKISFGQSVNFNEHPDLKEGKLIGSVCA